MSAATSSPDRSRDHSRGETVRTELERQLASALPTGSCWVGSSIDSDDSSLFDSERALMHSAVARRRHQFATGRRCARAALGKMGIGAAPLLANEHRAVRWPAGWVGSISHSDELCAAAVAPASRIAGLGIDIEPRAPLEAELWSEVASAAELEPLGVRTDASRGEVARLVFSAKESVFKCLHPHWEQWLDFADAQIALTFESADEGVFRAQLAPSAVERGAGPAQLAGRFVLGRSSIFSAAWIDAGKA